MTPQDENKVTDHEARLAAQKASDTAQRALDKIESHTRYCEERARRAAVFEADMRSEMRNLTGDFKEAFNRIHERLDAINKGTVTLQRAIIIGGGGAFFTGLCGVLWWLVEKTAGG